MILAAREMPEDVVVGPEGSCCNMHVRSMQMNQPAEGMKMQFFLQEHI